MDVQQQHQGCHSSACPSSSPSMCVLPPIMSRLSSEQTEIDSQVEFHIPVHHHHGMYDNKRYDCKNECRHDHYSVPGQKYIQYHQPINDAGSFLTPPPDTPLSAGTIPPPVQSVLNEPDRRTSQSPAVSRRSSSASSTSSSHHHSRVSLPPIHTLSFPKPRNEYNQQQPAYNSSTSYQNYVTYHSPTSSTQSQSHHQGYISPYSAIPSSAPTSGVVSPSRPPIHHNQPPYSAYPGTRSAFNDYNRSSGPLVSPPLTASVSHYSDHHYRSSAVSDDPIRIPPLQRRSGQVASEIDYCQNNLCNSYSASPSAPSYPYSHTGYSGGETPTIRESDAEYYSRHGHHYSNGARQYCDTLISPRTPASMTGHMDRRFTPYMTPPGRSGQSSSLPMSSPTLSSSVSPVHSPSNASFGKGSKTFECETCGKVMKRLCDYRSHVKIHTPNLEKPFHCPECPISFLRKHDLNRHVRIHAGKKPFTCERCGKGFVRRDALRRHESMDESMRKFRCVPGSHKHEAQKNEETEIKVPAAANDDVTKDESGKQEELKKSSSLNSPPSSPVMSTPLKSAAVTTHAPLVSAV